MQTQRATASSAATRTRRFGPIVNERRATQHFRSEPITDEDLEAILHLAGQAPSGFNLQPWRFIVVRDPASRERLCRAALNQTKITEAAAVIVAFALREGWSENVDEIFQAAADRGARPEADLEKQKRQALAFVGKLPIALWLNRHVMIAFTYLMLGAESLGWDTAPMEGFDPAAVRAAVGLPDDAEVVALLAIGRHREPDAPHPGRLPLEKYVYVENFGRPWSSPSND